MSEPEKENMKRGGRKDRKMRREGQQRQVNEGREKKKRQRNKCCPPENWHAEGQHLLRIMGPTLDECTRTHAHTAGCLLIQFTF